MESQERELHVYLDLCLPHDEFGLYHVCLCGQVLFRNSAGGPWLKCEKTLFIPKEEVERWMRVDEDTFVRVLRIHKFANFVVPRYYTELARDL